MGTRKVHVEHADSIENSIITRRSRDDNTRRLDQAWVEKRTVMIKARCCVHERSAVQRRRIGEVEKRHAVMMRTHNDAR
ncbi:hypothetical protein COLO4_14684 [Corchorus olitorius]|uniref:Uncharacterized protein n=1 Tax=Corchorus olitorius TaxID=93759 RepID=A0A1R3JR80_9ROSI|nr:hypothetical protein COLO4_14684 [Corchorus olitorius]